MVREIPLTRGYVALVDDEDYQRVSRLKWHARVQKHTVYAATTNRVNGASRVTYLHRLIVDAGPEAEVDHRDGNGLRCTRDNLRQTTHARNTANTTSRANKHGFRGICFAADRAGYRARIQIDGRKIYSRTFQHPKDAAREYDRLARVHHGEFARVNFPTGGERAA